MPLETDAIKSEIENSLKILADLRGETIASRIRPVLLANLARSRVQNFIEEDICLVHDYVLRVADSYESLSPLVNKLQVERASKAWEPLYKQMVLWAYHFFLKKGFNGSEHTQEIATGCATEAAMNILHAHFPYDTALQPWVCVIVQNACRRYIRSATKKSIIPEQNIVELDDKLSEIEDSSHQLNEALKDLRDDLSTAISKLSDTRRRVIEYVYYYELSPSEIASKMGKSVGAIYSLQFNALQDLRKILNNNGNNNNE